MKVTHDAEAQRVWNSELENIKSEIFGSCHMAGTACPCVYLCVFGACV